MKTERHLSATFDVKIDSGVATVKRDFAFNGATISYSVDVPIKGEVGSVTVLELNRRAVERVVELLQGMEPPQK